MHAFCLRHMEVMHLEAWLSFLGISDLNKSLETLRQFAAQAKLYAIWIEHNNQIFNNKRIGAEVLFKSIDRYPQRLLHKEELYLYDRFCILPNSDITRRCLLCRAFFFLFSLLCNLALFLSSFIKKLYLRSE